MEQAKTRNPTLLYALAWGVPGWVGTFWSQKTIDYLIAWLGCARRHHLHIDVSRRHENEGRGSMQYDARWTVELRSALRRDGFGSTRIAMADAFDPTRRVDDRPTSAPATASLRQVTVVVADHDVCGYPTMGLGVLQYHVPPRAAWGSPLWTERAGRDQGQRQARAPPSRDR